MRLNLPAGKLQKQYEQIEASINREYDIETDEGIRQYENCKIVITGLQNLLRETNPIHKDYKLILRNIKSRTFEMEYFRNKIYDIYLNEEVKRKRINELFELSNEGMTCLYCK